MENRQCIDIKSLDLEELQQLMESLGEKKYRAKQIYEWVHQKQAESFEEMTNVPKTLIAKLKERADLTVLKKEAVQVSQKDGTRKYLFALTDGNVIESVWMKYKHGNAVCISSQAGCRMGCRFCASALLGLARSLTAAEMLDQVYRIGKETGERVSNVVVMGTGEPLDNYENLLKFIRILTDENGLHISQRNVTVSTCGIVPRMRMLAEEKLQITLALSLHAPTQEKRAKLMPAAEQYMLSDVMEACSYYFAMTGRRVSFEYSLVMGMNDTDQEAWELIRLLKNLDKKDTKCHVNLIPVNPIKEREYVRPDRQSVLHFKEILERSGINVTVRREMGQDIDGACGQLRRKKLLQDSLIQ